MPVAISLFKMLVFVLLLSALPSTALSENTLILALNHSDFSFSRTDVDRSDTLQIPEDPNQFDLEFSSLKMAKAIFGPGVYIDFSEYEIEDENRILGKSHDRFETLTAGIAEYERQALWGDAEHYYQFGGGAGLARFHLFGSEDTDYYALAELFAETGLLGFDTLAIGIGGKYQLIGYPGETIAHSMVFYVSLSVWL